MFPKNIFLKDTSTKDIKVQVTSSEVWKNKTQLLIKWDCTVKM